MIQGIFGMKIKIVNEKEKVKETYFCSVEFSSHTWCEGGEDEDGDNGKAKHEAGWGLFHGGQKIEE